MALHTPRRCAASNQSEKTTVWFVWQAYLACLRTQPHAEAQDIYHQRRSDARGKRRRSLAWRVRTYMTIRAATSLVWRSPWQQSMLAIGSMHAATSARSAISAPARAVAAQWRRVGRVARARRSGPCPHSATPSHSHSPPTQVPLPLKLSRHTARDAYGAREEPVAKPAARAHGRRSVSCALSSLCAVTLSQGAR